PHSRYISTPSSETNRPLGLTPFGELPRNWVVLLRAGNIDARACARSSRAIAASVTAVWNCVSLRRARCSASCSVRTAGGALAPSGCTSSSGGGGCASWAAAPPAHVSVTSAIHEVRLTEDATYALPVIFRPRAP